VLSSIAVCLVWAVTAAANVTPEPGLPWQNEATHRSSPPTDRLAQQSISQFAGQWIGQSTGRDAALMHVTIWPDGRVQYHRNNVNQSMLNATLEGASLKVPFFSGFGHIQLTMTSPGIVQFAAQTRDGTSIATLRKQ
jgi:hypothetical protein